MDPMQTERSRPSEEDKPLTPARPPRVLVVEDDPRMRALLRFALSRRGFEVTEAVDGNDALERLGTMLLEPRRTRTTPDLLITDLRMPGCDGTELIETLRALGVRTPALLITAFGDESTVERAQRLGATAVLDKPFEMSLLLTLAKRLILPQRAAAGSESPRG